MESNMSPIIIEFNGLPGCGKTTTANNVTTQFKKEGKKVCELSDIGKLRNRFIFNELINIFKYGGIKFAFLLLWLAIKNSPFNWQRVEIAIMTHIIYANYLILSKIGCDCDVLVVDQGIIQGIISIFHTEDLNEMKETIANLITHLAKKNINFIIVNCICTSNIAFERIKLRKKCQGRFDMMHHENLMSNLKKQAVSFDILREILDKEKSIRIIDIAMEESVIKNSECIYNLCSKR